MNRSKVCTICKIELPLDSFYYNKHGGHYIGKCKPCYKELTAEYKRLGTKRPWICPGCNFINSKSWDKIKCRSCDRFRFPDGLIECNTCGEVKHEKDFPKNRRRLLGIEGQCKQCKYVKSLMRST